MSKDKTLILSVKERLELSVLYPEAQDILTATTVRSITNKTEPTQSEIKEISLRQEINKQGQPVLVWDEKKGKDKKINFSESEIRILKDGVTRLDRDKKITQSILDLCLKVRDA